MCNTSTGLCVSMACCRADLGSSLWQCRMLEEVGRMPYIAYVTVLHLYETVGWLPVGTEQRRVQ